MPNLSLIVEQFQIPFWVLVILLGFRFRWRWHGKRYDIEVGYWPRGPDWRRTRAPQIQTHSQQMDPRQRGGTQTGESQRS